MSITHWGFTITKQREQLKAAFLSAEQAIIALQVAVEMGWYVEEVHKWYSLPLTSILFESVGDFTEILECLEEKDYAL